MVQAGQPTPDIVSPPCRQYSTRPANALPRARDRRRGAGRHCGDFAAAVKEIPTAGRGTVVGISGRRALHCATKGAQSRARRALSRRGVPVRGASLNGVVSRHAPPPHRGHLPQTQPPDMTALPLEEPAKCDFRTRSSPSTTPAAHPPAPDHTRSHSTYSRSCPSDSSH